MRLLMFLGLLSAGIVTMYVVFFTTLVERLFLKLTTSRRDKVIEVLSDEVETTADAYEKDLKEQRITTEKNLVKLTARRVPKAKV